MRRHTSEMKFRFLGDTDAAKTLIPLARKLMGGLLESAKHNGLKVLCRHWTINDILTPKDDSQKKTKGKAAKKQADHEKKGRQDRFDAVPEGVEYPDNSTIDVYWYANICLAVINVPRLREKREGVDMLRDSVKGFIVNVRFTNMESMVGDGRFIWALPYVAEPGIGDDSPDIQDDSGWVWDIGERVHPFNREPNSDLISLTEWTWREGLVNDEATGWNGFNRGDHAVLRYDAKNIRMANPIYYVSMVYRDYNLSYSYTANPNPITIGYLNPVHPPLDEIYATGRIYYTANSAPYLTIPSIHDADQASFIAKHAEVFALMPSYEISENEKNSESHEFVMNDNGLIAGAGNLTGDTAFTIERPKIPYYPDDILVSYGGPKYTHYYTALLPTASSIGSWFKDLHPSASVTEDDYAHYSVLWGRAIDDGAVTWPWLDEFDRPTKYPSTFLQPEQTYVDYLSYQNTQTYNYPTTGGMNVVTDAKAGEYKVDIKSWLTGAWPDQGLSPSGYSVLDGMEFEFDIKLFGSGFIANITGTGITGEKNDKIRILVNQLVEFEEGNVKDLSNKLVKISH